MKESSIGKNQPKKREIKKENEAMAAEPGPGSRGAWLGGGMKLGWMGGGSGGKG